MYERDFARLLREALHNFEQEFERHYAVLAGGLSNQAEPTGLLARILQPPAVSALGANGCCLGPGTRTGREGRPGDWPATVYPGEGQWVSCR